MACFKPLTGYRARKVNPSGRRPVVFSIVDGYRDRPVPLPCGQCLGCRLERSRQWAVRCMHEASLHLLNCSLTLTYSDEHLPIGGSLVPADPQKFIKRLRKRFSDRRISYFLCGEYGGEFGRAHYHVLLFGLWFVDAVPFKRSRSGCQLYRSDTLDKLWPWGHADIGELTFESAAYAARYCVDKITGDAAVEHYRGRLPEFVRMSLRPAIGRRWFERFSDDVFPSDEVVVRGRVSRPPLYYDKLLDEAMAEKVKEARAKRSLRSLSNRSPDRLEVREQVARARLNLYREEPL